MTQRAISEWEDDFRKMSTSDIFLNSPDFEVPIYDDTFSKIWKRLKW